MRGNLKKPGELREFDRQYRSAKCSRRQPCRFPLSALGLFILLVFAGPSRSAAQQPMPPMQPGGRPSFPNQVGGDPLSQDSGMPADPTDPIMQERRMRALNVQRQKSLVADTNKLLKLASELNVEVNGKHSSELTPDQLRKVAEIEKLAHSVREKMVTSVRPVPMMTLPGLMGPPTM